MNVLEQRSGECPEHCFWRRRRRTWDIKWVRQREMQTNEAFVEDGSFVTLLISIDGCSRMR
eukprot:3284261-Amphidinium_carterae.1